MCEIFVIVELSRTVTYLKIETTTTTLTYRNFDYVTFKISVVIFFIVASIYCIGSGFQIMKLRVTKQHDSLQLHEIGNVLLPLFRSFEYSNSVKKEPKPVMGTIFTVICKIVPGLTLLYNVRKYRICSKQVLNGQF